MVTNADIILILESIEANGKLVKSNGSVMTISQNSVSILIFSICNGECISLCFSREISGDSCPVSLFQSSLKFSNSMFYLLIGTFPLSGNDLFQLFFCPFQFHPCIHFGNSQLNRNFLSRKAF